MRRALLIGAGAAAALIAGAFVAISKALAELDDDWRYAP